MRSIAMMMGALLGATALTVNAQEPAKPVTPVSTTTQVPLRVQLVVSRFSGEKKISSVPYILSVVANDNDKTSLRMGVDVPVPQSVFVSPKEGGPASMPMTSFTYRSIGTNIDCSARTVGEGIYKLDLGVSDSTIFVTEKAASGATVAGVPTIRSFTATFNVLLKDGQTAQHTSATDPISGEVLRVDVTLNVLK